MVIPHSENALKSKIFPIPRIEEHYDGSYKLKENYNTEDLYAFYCAVKGGTKDITIKTDVTREKEGYIIDITAEGITVLAATDEGVFRALISVRQIIVLEGKELGYLHIDDKPDLKERCGFIDLSFGRVGKLDEIKRQIDFFVGAKYNQVTFYMENIGYKWENFPDLTDDIDGLTSDDIIELDQYCKDRFIELFPSTNCFGHMNNFLKFDQYAHLAIGGKEGARNSLNPLLKESYEFVDKMQGSLLPYFSSKKVNIGFDEAFDLGTYETEAVCKEKGREQVSYEWLLKMCEIFHDKYGKEEIYVSFDMFYHKPEYYKMMPEYCIVMFWAYGPTCLILEERNCEFFKNNGIKYVTMSATQTYGGFTCMHESAIATLRSNAELAYKHGAMGTIATDWSYACRGTNFVWSYVPLAFAGQMHWNIGIQQEEWAAYFKNDFYHAAEEFCDRYIFKAPVSRLLTYMSNYNQLEPERVHGHTICGSTFIHPLSQRHFPYFYSIDELGDAFPFENVINYMTSLVDKVAVIDFDERLKRGIIVNARTVILSAEYAIVKINRGVTRRKAEQIAELSKWIERENREVWAMAHYMFGIEVFEENLNDRLSELSDFIVD